MEIPSTSKNFTLFNIGEFYVDNGVLEETDGPLGPLGPSVRTLLISAAKSESAFPFTD